jgi:hypothetical protein
MVIMVGDMRTENCLTFLLLSALRLACFDVSSDCRKLCSLLFVLCFYFSPFDNQSYVKMGDEIRSWQQEQWTRRKEYETVSVLIMNFYEFLFPPMRLSPSFLLSDLHHLSWSSISAAATIFHLTLLILEIFISPS